MINIPDYQLKVADLFGFLSELSQLKTPQQVTFVPEPWSLYWDQLPVHPYVKHQGLVSKESTLNNEDSLLPELLTVTKPKSLPCPKHPSLLSTWLDKGNYQDPDSPPEFIAQREHPTPKPKAIATLLNNVLSDNLEEDTIEPPPLPLVVEVFEDDPARVEARAQWLKDWHHWASEERQNRLVQKLFQKLYDLHSLLDREGGQLELVFQDGWLLQNISGQSQWLLHMPLISLKCQISFDPKTPSFTLAVIEEAIPELNTSVLGMVPNLPINAIATIKTELEDQGYNPTAAAECVTFLEGMANRLGPEAQCHSKPLTSRDVTSNPQIYPRPVLTVRKRAAGLTDALKKVAETLQQVPVDNLSLPLIHLVGEGASSNAPVADSSLQEEAMSSSSALHALPHLDPEILFSKPANQEQLQIAHRLDRHGAVLVQGPPGTGKTHTIANLIGHLLAQGKTILVTAHTTKALKVVRDKVVPSLQGLCVNVLDSDSESKRLLEASIDTISDRLGSINPLSQSREIEQLTTTRNQLIEQTRIQQAKLRAIIQSEYEPVVVQGQSFRPVEAAQLLAEGIGLHDWLPGPLPKTVPLPLSTEDLDALYASQVSLTPEEEIQLSQKLPQLNQLPTPDEFSRWVASWHEWQSVPQESQAGAFWETPPAALQEKDLESLLEAVEDLTRQLEKAEGWQKALIQKSMESRALMALWQKLLMDLKPLHESQGRIEAERIQRNPQLAPAQAIEAQVPLLKELLDHLESGKGLGIKERLLKKHWFSYLEQVRCYGKPLAPKSVTGADIRALLHVAEFQQSYDQACVQWDQLMAGVGGPKTATLGESPLTAMLQYQPILENWLNWHALQWQPVQTQLQAAGLDWHALEAAQPVITQSRTGLVDRLYIALNEGLRPQFTSVLAQKKLDDLQAQFTQVADYLSTYIKEGTAIDDLHSLHRALLDLDNVAYATYYGQLHSLLSQYELFTRRLAWLKTLSSVAPQWANLIAQRQAGHQDAQPPGDCQKAWIYRQVAQVLEERHEQSLPKVQQELTRLYQALMEITAELIEKRAWLAQKNRVGVKEQQALEGWKKTVQKIGKGTGKKAPELRIQAKALMAQCKGAVPVWIMPFDRVVENFPPAPNTVDVVIIDEASQLDLRGLLLLFMAKQVIVVGDDKQVTPDAVGQEVGKETQLQMQWLNGRIPNAILYDGKASIYDRAKEVFGQTIMLKEHFRCVPEIIAYCNTLSYEERIVPLRDPSNVVLKPHWVPVYVPEAYQKDKVNPKEAEYTASLVAACLNDPAFTHTDGEPVTVGIISLFGAEQAEEIDRILKQKVEPSVLERHKVDCTIPAKFQGDERDVMFLSMVYAPKESGGPHTLMEFGVEDMYRKRFNVAVSRAKDQIWLVHSLRPEIDLKSTDIRRKLLEYAQNPQAQAIRLEQLASRTESPFEKAVLEGLLAAGYDPVPQWKVGAYRIDFVISDKDGRRVAIECDGEKYHGVDRLEQDLARQAQLERLGWQFIRIRGSVYYRNPAKEMKRIVAKLQELDLYPRTLENDAPRPTLEAEGAIPLRIQAAAAEMRELWKEGNTQILLSTIGPQHNAELSLPV